MPRLSAREPTRRSSWRHDRMLGQSGPGSSFVRTLTMPSLENAYRLLQAGDLVEPTYAVVGMLRAADPVIVEAGGGQVSSYDFFLAHAGSDTAQAERLYDLLVAETSVFLDSKSIVLGDDWDRVLAEAQRHSRVTVVLVSANSDVAFYQREEIAEAIELA